MAKKESTLLNMVITLMAVTLIASTALGYIYELTKEPIAKAKLAKRTQAIREVLPEFNNSPVEDMYTIASPEGEDSLQVYPAIQDGERIGAAVRTYSKKGFSGLIWLMVGITDEGEIYDIAVLEHKETPGLGTKMADPKFKDQFKGKNPEDFNIMVKNDGGDVDAITAATISSRAFSDAVQRAHEAYMEGGKQ